MKGIISHPRSSSESPSKSVISSGVVVDFTLIPAAVLQASKLEMGGKTNGNSHCLHLIHMPEK
jgi:hypothetical protein